MTGYFRLLPNGDKQELTAEETAPYIAGTKRHRMLHAVKVIFTEAEETARDAEEAAWAASQAAREAAALRLALDQSELSAAANDANTPAWLNRTPAQVDQWIDNTATNLAGVVTVLKVMAKILIHVARRTLRK